MSRTGTTSLATAMHNVGYVSIHSPLDFFDYVNHTFQYRPSVVEGYNFIGDIQPSLVFEQLATAYPTAKFVYTKRNPSLFALSAKKFFSDRALAWNLSDLLFQNGILALAPHQLFKAMYGANYLNYDLNEWEAAYKRYDGRVQNYFRDSRGQRLLELDATIGEGWEKLAPFLNDSTLPRSGSLPPVDVFASILHQSWWSVENLIDWVHYANSKRVQPSI